MARTVVVGDDAVSGGEFKLIPVGEKLAATIFSIEEVPVRTGDNAGKPQLDVTFKIQGGEFNGREIRYQKIPLYDGAAAWKLVSFAGAVGLTVNGKNVELPDSWSGLLGKPLMIKISQQADNKGTMRNNVSGYGPVTDGAVAAQAANEAPSWSNVNS